MPVLFNIIWRELKIIAQTKSFYAMGILAPIVIFFLYLFIYNQQAIRDLPIAIWDQDHSKASRLLIRQYHASPIAEVCYHVQSAQEIHQLMKANKIQGAVHIPKHFERNIFKSSVTPISTYRNGSNIVFAGLLQKAFAEITLTFNAGIVLNKLTAQGTPKNTAKSLANPIPVIKHPLYNSTYNYQNYLAPGLITVTIQMILIMMAVLIINKEFADGTFYYLLEISKNSALTIIIGKVIAHYLIGMMQIVLCFGIYFHLFQIPYSSNFAAYFIIFSLLITACTSIGLLISVLFNEALMAADLALFYTAPAFVFSGFTYPIWAMPWFDQIYAYLIPYTHFLQAFLKIYQMESPVSSIILHLIPLIYFIAIPLSASWALLKIKILKMHYVSY